MKKEGVVGAVVAVGICIFVLLVYFGSSILYTKEGVSRGDIDKKCSEYTLTPTEHPTDPERFPGSTFLVTYGEKDAVCYFLHLRVGFLASKIMSFPIHLWFAMPVGIVLNLVFYGFIGYFLGVRYNRFHSRQLL